MPPARVVGLLALGAALLILRADPAAAQAELQMWLNPEMGKQMPRSDYRYTFYPERKVEQQEAHFGVTEQRVTLFAPLYQNSTDEFAISGRVLYQNIDTTARFPEAGGAFPPELWDIAGTVSYRHKFDNGWTGGLAFSTGSASDEPFNSIDEMFFRAVGLVRVPQGEKNSWIFTLIYATDEQIMGMTLPLPGIAYAWLPSEKFTAVIGFPFSMIQFKPWEPLSFDFEYYPFWTVRSRVTWTVFRPLRVYGGFQWDSDHYYRADRDDPQDKIFYREMRLYGGIRFDLRHIGVEFTSGWTFNRFYYEGEGYKDRHDNRFDVEDSVFFVGKLNVRF